MTYPFHKSGKSDCHFEYADQFPSRNSFLVWFVQSVAVDCIVTDHYFAVIMVWPCLPFDGPRVVNCWKSLNRHELINAVGRLSLGHFSIPVSPHSRCAGARGRTALPLHARRSGMWCWNRRGFSSVRENMMGRGRFNGPNPTRENFQA